MVNTIVTIMNTLSFIFLVFSHYKEKNWTSRKRNAFQGIRWTTWWFVGVEVGGIEGMAPEI